MRTAICFWDGPLGIFSTGDRLVKRLGLDNSRPSVILGLAVELTDKRQTGGDAGAQSEGPGPGRLAAEVNEFARKFVQIRPALTSYLRDRGVRWLVRPGLFLVREMEQTTGGGRVVLAVAAAMLAAAMCPTPVVAAEQAVGLEAQGVDPWAALRNGQGLDVRDANGRPVSAQLIERQLRAASARAEAQKADLSRLPKARVIFRLLELLPSLTGFWGLPFPLNPARGEFALPTRTRSGQKSSAAGGLVAAVVLSLAVGCRGAQVLSRRSPSAVVALRC